MKSINFKIYYTDMNNSIKFDERIYSSCVRYSVERFYEQKSPTNIYQDCVSKFSLNCHLIGSAIREAKGIFNRFKDTNKKIVFGDFKRYLRNLISKEEYKESKNIGVFCEGEANQYGNRYFKLDIQNNSIIYKRSRNEHIVLKLEEKLSDKRKKLLESIYLSMINKESPVSFRIKKDNLYITYNETIIEKYKRFKDLKSNRILGLDLNPNYIGLSILEFNSKDEFKIIHKRVYDLSGLNEEGSTNKVKYELQQIDNEILKLCKHYKVSKLVVEDLKFKKNNKFWSKKLNRLCKNKFRYTQIKNHLQILCNTFGVEYIEVNAAYSSFIGNFCYGSIDTPDMVSASIELARRGYKKFSKEWFYPPIITLERIKEVLGNQWKKELKLNFNSWKIFFNQIKKLKLNYRFQLDGSKAVLRKIYQKQFISILTFNNL